MKQYWRVGTIRSLLGLVLGMFVLGRKYYPYVPILADEGLIGALVLGTLLVFLFMGLGWLYDEKAKMWSQQVQATTERNAYQYVANYKTYAFNYPILYALLLVLNKTLTKLNLSTRAIPDSIAYMDIYFKRKLVKRDIFSALPAAKEYMKKHPFAQGADTAERPIGLRSRIKLGFQVQLLRLTWIQSLTGLLQDVLVFGALYVVLFVPESVTAATDTVPLEYLVLGILFISLPLFMVLASLGWIYDRRLRIWSPDMIVKFERNPYQYLPEPYLHIQLFPFYLALFSTIRQVFMEAGLDATSIDRVLAFLQEYSELDVARTEDMDKAKRLRKSLGVLFS